MIMDSLFDDLEDEIKEDNKEKKSSSSSKSDSDSESEGGDIDMDLDSMIADIEKQDKSRRVVADYAIKPVGARKNPKLRQQSIARGALDGDDLDRILDEIQRVTKARAAQAVETLTPGWGVVNAERKFDLMAPEFAMAGTPITATLMIASSTGTRLPLQHITVKIIPQTKGAPPVTHTLTDNKDGTYAIEFEATKENVTYQIQIDAYNQRQFEWDIKICEHPEPSQCIALPDPNGFKVGQSSEVIICSRDKNGNELKVGGAKLGLSFKGTGELSDVGLVDRMDGTYAISFVPSAPGKYAVWVTVGGIDIKTSPLEFVAIK